MDELDDHGSSLEAASAAAAKINAMLIAKGKLKLPTAVVPAAQQAPKLKVIKAKEEPIIAEVEINDVPLQCRNMLTRGSTQEEISKTSGAAVSTRGRFMSYADRAKNNMGERPLYLCVQGLNKECVDGAVQRIRSIIDESMSKSKGRGKGKSRLFGQMEPPSATSPQSRQRGPFVSQNPAPMMTVPPSAPLPVQPTGPYIQEKVFVGLEHTPLGFGVRDKILGPGGSFIQHIRTETGASVYLRGRGSGYLEPTSGREAFENLYIYITHPKLEGVLAAKKLCENLVQTIHAEYGKHQSQSIASPTPVVRMVIPASITQQGQPVVAHSSTTAVIQQPATGAIHRIQVPTVIQQPATHTLTINQQGAPQPAAPTQQVGLAQVGNTVVGVVSSSMGPSITQGSIQRVSTTQSGQLVYTVPTSTGIIYPHLQQVAPHQVTPQPQAQQTVLVQQVAIPRPVPAPAQAASQGIIQQQVQQQMQQHHQQQILNAQLSAAQTVGLIRAPAATSQHSVIQGTSTVLVQHHQPPTNQQQMQQQHHHQQQIQQQIHQQIQQQQNQQEQQQQVHQIQQQQQLQQLQQQQAHSQQTVVQGSHLTGTSPSLPEQRSKRRFREAPDDDPKDGLLGYQHGPPHLTNLGAGRPVVSITQAMTDQSEPSAPHQAVTTNTLGPPQMMTTTGPPSDDRILMRPPSIASMGCHLPAGDIDKHLMPPPSLPPAKGIRMSLIEEPPLKRSKGLVSYDGGDSDDDDDIIRSPQAHSHFQPSRQLPVIFQRSASPQSQGTSIRLNSPEKLDYAFPSSGPAMGQPPQQRIIVSQGSPVITTEKRIHSVEQPHRSPVSVSQGVEMPPPHNPRPAQQSLLGDIPRFPHQQPFWMSP